MKYISILGSTGSIGQSTLEVIRKTPGFKVVGLAAKSAVDELARQIDEFSPEIVAVWDESSAELLKEKVAGNVHVVSGLKGLCEVAAHKNNTMVVSAVVGSAGLVPTLKAVEQGIDIALANKEVLVIAGELVMNAAKLSGARILPVDSEHSAIFQCLDGVDPNTIRRIIITASGGPFLHTSREKLQTVTLDEVLDHPKWAMGKKVTIDSAGLINKGLEVIEALWLFGIDIDKIEVVIHKESIIHSMVEYIDGSVLAQLSVPDMKIPIQYALTYPGRENNIAQYLDFTQLKTLSFDEPDTERFPGLKLAYKAARGGGTLPAVFNAANEVAVSKFIDGQIGFMDIPYIVEGVMNAHEVIPCTSVDVVLEVDAWARKQAHAYIENKEMSKTTDQRLQIQNEKQF
ncbi:MAG: 1-deoxy-D-xylulose-5-phosphate reductoisomerase [Candidatus Ancaeobacter aquaticus]|nr:1-deoxy-D-xylulose-5-phosphate reductoisomerase [Candidatus Ancaeobacter aquaticus]